MRLAGGGCWHSLSIGVAAHRSRPICASTAGARRNDTLKVIAPEFEKATGHRLNFTFAVVGAIQAAASPAAKRPIVVLLPVPLLNALDNIRQAPAGQQAPARARRDRGDRP